MAIDLTDPALVEDDRLQRVSELEAEQGPEWAGRFRPGTWGCHELLDRTSIIARLVEETILEHPACLQHSEWYALADRAASALNELYQRIGAVHLDETGESPEGR